MFQTFFYCQNKKNVVQYEICENILNDFSPAVRIKLPDTPFYLFSILA